MICALEDLGGCGGRLEWDHVVKQHRIKREYKHGAVWSQGRFWPASRYDRVGVSRNAFFEKTLDDILGDTRNRRWLCTRHHELVTNHRVEAPIPGSVWEFAAEFGFTAQLENDIARRSAA